MKAEAKKEQERKAKAQANAEFKKPMPRPDSGWSNHKARGGPHPQPSATSHKAAEPFKPKPVEKALHPSWEAKRKLKEKEGAAIVPSQGKKITF